MNINILDKSLLKSLLDENISFYEVMNAYDIKTSIVCNIPSSILGFVYVSRREKYYIILNGNVNYKTQCKTFVHEIKHIIYDLPRTGYIVGLNMQHTYLENKADRIAENMYSYITKEL